jgi:hypothetical protein
LNNKFKKTSDNNYYFLRENCTHWCNKYCNNGAVSLKGLRKCFDWKNSYIVLCKNVFMIVPYEIFMTID